MASRKTRCSCEGGGAGNALVTRRVQPLFKRCTRREVRRTARRVASCYPADFKGGRAPPTGRAFLGPSDRAAAPPPPPPFPCRPPRSPPHTERHGATHPRS